MNFDFKISNLEWGKNGKKILQDLSVYIPHGSLTVLIGPNGAGKSSFMRCLAGLQNYQSGEILLAGKSINDYSLAQRAQTLSWCPAETQLAFSYPCLELVCMGRFPTHAGFPQPRDYEIAKVAMAILGLSDLYDQTTDRLSSGAMHKLMIARVLASQNKVMLFDEPDAHLDIACVFQVMSLLKELSCLGKTICVSLHNLQVAYRYADHVILLNDGKKMGEGSPVQIIEQELISSHFRVNMSRVKTASEDHVFFNPFSKTCQMPLSMIKEIS